jgi:hypothetical protein
MAVVTAFYDSFYWAQIDLLLAAMGGVLSVRLGLISKPHPDPRPALAPAQDAPRRDRVSLAT